MKNDKIIELAELFDGIDGCAELDDILEEQNVAEIGELGSASGTATASKTKSSITKFYNDIAKKIVDRIRKGTVPWQSGIIHNYVGFPMNIRSKKIYHGFNIFILGKTTEDHHFSSRWWGTKKQIEGYGDKIKKDEKHTMIAFFKKIEKRGDDGKIELDEDGEEVLIPMMKFYKVYNLEQTENLDSAKFPELPVKKSDWKPHKLAESIKDDYLKRTKLEFKQGSKPQPYYNYAKDFVYMPHKTVFSMFENYYEALFHELGHSTMHAKRLKRIYGSSSKLTLHSKKDYSFEELIAEFCTAFVCGFCGIARDVKNQASYIQGWAKYITDNKFAIMRAIGKARKASSYILGKYLKKFHDEIRQAAKEASKKSSAKTKYKSELGQLGGGSMSSTKISKTKSVQKKVTSKAKPKSTKKNTPKKPTKKSPGKNPKPKAVKNSKIPKKKTELSGIQKETLLLSAIQSDFAEMDSVAIPKASKGKTLKAHKKINSRANTKAASCELGKLLLSAETLPISYWLGSNILKLPEIKGLTKAKSKKQSSKPIKLTSTQARVVKAKRKETEDRIKKSKNKKAEARVVWNHVLRLSTDMKSIIDQIQSGESAYGNLDYEIEKLNLLACDLIGKIAGVNRAYPKLNKDIRDVVKGKFSAVGLPDLKLAKKTKNLLNGTDEDSGELLDLDDPKNKNKMDFFKGEKFSLDNLPDVVLTKDDNDTINGKVTSIQHAIKKDDPIQHAETLNKIAGEAEANMLMASKHNERDDVLLAREHMIDGISFTLAGVRECPNHPIILKLAPLLKSKIKRT